MEKSTAKTISLLLVIIALMVIYISGIYIFDGNEKNPTENIMKADESLALMLEDEDGNYQVAPDTSWPTSGYVFNAALSSCENGSLLTFDETTHQVKMTIQGSDKCYAYFDRA
ncbi:MAG: hypothetical protein K2M17_03295 [Bacilli bacterium]|nr:hypothetical protein [Bacilli bacterium]